MVTIVDALAQVVGRHLPSSRGRPATLGPDSRSYAEELLSADVNDASAFGVSKDKAEVEEIAKGLRSCAQKIKRLSMATQNAASFAFRDWSTGGLKGLNLLDDGATNFAVTLLVVAESLDGRFQINPALGTPAEPRTNWRAVAVTDRARMIWAMDEFYSNPKKYGPVPGNPLAITANEFSDEERASWSLQRSKYLSFLENYAPVSQNHNRPGPFGMFLEDVFEVLGIVARNEGPVSAATALDAWRKLRRQELPKKNLTTS